MLLRWLVSHLMQNAAQQGLRTFTEKGFATLSETAPSESLPQGRSPQDKDADSPNGGEIDTPEIDAPEIDIAKIDVVLLFAEGVEAGGSLDMLEGALPCRGEHCTGVVGAWAGRRVAVFQSGVGMENAAAAAKEVIGAFQPNWIVSAGFAAALVETVRRGDILLPDHVGAADEETMEVGMPWGRNSASAPGLHAGKLLTLDHLARDRSEREQLQKAHSALAYDMETFAIARVCREAGVRLLAARVITDGVDDALPPELEKLLEQNSWASRAGAAAGAIFNRPAAIKDIWRIKQDAMKASDRLATFLAGVISQLP